MLLAFTMTVCLGSLSSIRVDPRNPRARERRLLTGYLHRAAAVTGMLLIVVHATALVADHQSGVAAGAVFVPLTSGYRPVAVALGSAAAYLFVFVAVAGAARRQIAASRHGARAWRALHATSYLAWGLCVLHGLLAGTDAGSTWLTVTVAGCVAALSVCLAVRLLAELLARHRSLASARRELALALADGIRP